MAPSHNPSITKHFPVYYVIISMKVIYLILSLSLIFIVFQSFTSPKKEKECFKLINDGSVDGVIVFSAANNECLIEKLQYDSTVPTVFLKEESTDIENSDIEELAKMYFHELLLKVL